MKSDPISLLIRFFVYLLLFCGAIVVLLPLFWMVLTACKQSGQALEFKFLPESVSYGAKKLITPPQSGLANVTFEYDPADYPQVAAATQVTVAGEFNAWDKDRDHLQKDGKVWVTTLTNLKPGRYEYKLVVNGGIWTPDRGHDRQSDNGNSVITLTPGTNTNKPLADATKLASGKLQFKVRRPQASQLQIKLANQEQLLTLSKNAQGYFVGECPAPQRSEYQIVQPQSFMEGLKKIYTLRNFARVLTNKQFPFGRFFLNSLIVASGTALLTVIICTMGGYVFAKKNFLLRDKLFGVLLSTMLIPGMIFMVPQFAIVNKLGWINSYVGMMVPHLANVFGLFLMRQYISTIPDSLFEAATIDGAGELQIFKIIIIPLSLPVMVTLFLMTFVMQWGNFLWQLIVNTPDSVYRTLPVGLALFRGQYGQDWEMMMAGACFSIIPIAILFLAAQRVFIEGMTSGAVKE